MDDISTVEKTANAEDLQSATAQGDVEEPVSEKGASDSDKALEDMRKRLEHEKALSAKYQSEKDKALAEAEKLRDERIAKLTDLALANAQKEGSASDQEAYDQMVKELEEGGAEAQIRLIETHRRTISEDFERKLAARDAAREAEIEAKLEAKIAARALRLDESYRKHETEVKEYVEEFGVDEATALRMVKKFNKTTQALEPDRAMQSVGGTTVAAGVSKTYKIPDGERRHFIEMGYTDKEIDALEARRKAEAKR